MSTVTLAHNPKAGTGRHSVRHLAELVAKAGYDVRCVSAKRPDLAALFRAPGAMAIAAGGDGTVARVVRALEAADTPLAILPLGTANNIARALGVRGPMPKIVADWRHERWRPFDLATVEGPGKGRRTLVEGLGIGALAEAARTHQASEGRRGDPVATLREAQRWLADALLAAKPVAALEVNGADLSRAALFVEVLNVPLTGPRLRLCRGVDPGDGLLDIVYAGERERRPLAEWLRDGAPADEAPRLQTLPPSAVVRVRWASATLRIDDAFEESSKKDARLSAAVRAAPIRVVVPAGRRK